MTLTKSLSVLLIGLTLATPCFAQTVTGNAPTGQTAPTQHTPMQQKWQDHREERQMERKEQRREERQAERREERRDERRAEWHQNHQGQGGPTQHSGPTSQNPTQQGVNTPNYKLGGKGQG